MSIVLEGTKFLHRDPVANAAPFTVSVWFKSTDADAFQAAWAEGAYAGTLDYWRLGLRGNAAGDPVGCYVRRDGAADAFTSTGYEVNRWHHAMFIEASSQDHRVYIDGGSEGTDTANDQAPINLVAMSVGAMPYNGSWIQYFSGKIAEVTIWSVVLSAAERASVIAGVDPSTIQPGNLVVYYPLEENPNDYGGSGLDLDYGGPAPDPSFDAEDVPKVFRRQFYDSGDNTYQALAATSQWIGQTFTPASSHSCSRIRLKMYRANSPGTLTVSIRATDEITGHPVTPDLRSGTLDVNSITTSSSGEWYNIYLSSGIDLTAGTKYAIVCRCSTADGSNKLHFRLDNSDSTYPGGAEEWSTDSGEDWHTFSTNDLMFEEWGDLPSVIAPTITDQSSSSTVLRGQETPLFITATGTPTPTYQWYLDGNIISGETNSTITVYPMTTGIYTCIATNAGGSAESNPIVLTVVGNPYRYNPFNLPLDKSRTD